MTPDGGFADELRETFHARLGDLTAGEHLVSVRAVDAAGNAATKAARVIVPKPR
jgi:hypothetical protein